MIRISARSRDMHCALSMEPIALHTSRFTCQSKRFRVVFVHEPLHVQLARHDFSQGASVTRINQTANNCYYSWSPGKVSFVYSCMQTRLMGQNNGERSINLVYESKPLMTVIITTQLENISLKCPKTTKESFQNF